MTLFLVFIERRVQFI